MTTTPVPEPTTAPVPESTAASVPEPVEGSGQAPITESVDAPDSASVPEPVEGPRPPVDLSGALEALLLMATEPMPTVELAQAVASPVHIVDETLQELATFYDQTQRGFELRQVGAGWRYYTRPEHAPVINRYVLEGQHGRLTQAALETLAVIAYLQPATRSRISAVRGVSVDGVVRTLLARDLIVETARDELSGAALFSTTPYFLERMGMASLDELPPLAPHLPDAMALEAELAETARAAEAPSPELAASDESSEVAASDDDGPDEAVPES